jgi:hypothetical protein
LLKFLTHFWGPISSMMEIAVVLSGVAGHWPDFFIILVLLIAGGAIIAGNERGVLGSPCLAPLRGQEHSEVIDRPSGEGTRRSVGVASRLTACPDPYASGLVASARSCATVALM